MSDLCAPYRYDVVGSFLRPASLKQARLDFAEGKITREELTAAEDEAIRDLVAKEKAVGLKFVTDGEFRRNSWHLDFMWAFEGVGHHPTKTGLRFHDEAAMLDDTYLTGKVSVGHHPFVDHFKFVQSIAGDDVAVKQTIPAPAQFLEQMILPFAQENSTKYYSSDWEELVEDIAAGYRKVIRELYDAGCRNLQFDDCSWGMVVDPRAPQIFGVTLTGLKNVMELLLKINNLALEGKPKDMVVNTHVCRGNFHSSWASSGGYDRVAQTLFARENVDNFYLEFDDERSGGFEPLEAVAGDKKVVLGLITSKSPKLEDKEQVIERIHEAAKYIPLDRLCLSTQCGFASCEIGNKLSEEEQWTKVALVRDIAKEVWGE